MADNKRDNRLWLVALRIPYRAPVSVAVCAKTEHDAYLRVKERYPHLYAENVSIGATEIKSGAIAFNV